MVSRVNECPYLCLARTSPYLHVGFTKSPPNLFIAYFCFAVTDVRNMISPSQWNHAGFIACAVFLEPRWEEFQKFPL